MTYVLVVSVCVCVWQVRRHVRPWFQSSRSWSLTYDVLTFVTTRVAIAYITVPFVLLEFWTSVEFYRLVALYSALGGDTARHFSLSAHYRSVTVLSIQERHRDISVSLHNRAHRETFQSLCTLQVSDSSQQSAKTQRDISVSLHTTVKLGRLVLSQFVRCEQTVAMFSCCCSDTRSAIALD